MQPARGSKLYFLGPCSLHRGRNCIFGGRAACTGGRIVFFRVAQPAQGSKLYFSGPCSLRGGHNCIFWGRAACTGVKIVFLGVVQPARGSKLYFWGPCGLHGGQNCIFGCRTECATYPTKLWTKGTHINFEGDKYIYRGYHFFYGGFTCRL